MIHTIGHSTRTYEEFRDLLKEHDVDLLVDVRSYPGSRRYPHFGKKELDNALWTAGINYVHIPKLGGRRPAAANSINKGWRHASFRGYADYMETAAFQDGVVKLIDLAEQWRTAIMCSEAVPWKCHRQLVADALLVRGLEVRDIIGPGQTKPHTLTPFARCDGLHLWYPAA